MFQKKILPALVLSGVVSEAAMAATFYEVSSFAAQGNAVQVVHSAKYDTLVYRNSASAIRTVDLSSNSHTGTNLAFNAFYDMDVVSGGRYVYASDYGGERTGYGTPINQHFVHRYDLLDGTWASKTTDNIAGKLEAVSDDNFLLLERDQWVSMTYNTWGTDSSTSELGSVWADYRGDFEYDENTGRIIHGNSGSSSREINTWRLSGTNFFAQEGSGIYGSANSGGGTAVLSHGGKDFYYGSLQVDALDVTNNQRVFDEIIYAAFDDIAFGANGYYDAKTGELLGDLGFSSRVYSLSDDGNSFWAFNPDDDTFHQFGRVSDVPVPAAAWLFGSALVGLFGIKRKKSKLVIE